VIERLFDLCSLGNRRKPKRKPREYVKIKHFVPVVFLQNSAPAVPREWRRKYRGQKLVEFGGKLALFMRFGPFFFYDESKARRDKMFVLPLIF